MPHKNLSFSACSTLKTENSGDNHSIFSGIPEGKENIRSLIANVSITVATGGMSSWLALSCRTAEARRSLVIFDTGLWQIDGLIRLLE